MPLTQLHPLVRDWFLSRFDAPTEAQSQGWPAIARGRHTLIAAPTGSGKTLAAFLMCIDGLVRRALAGDLPDTTQVVYVSPLKALSNDISKNLEVPLSEIQALAEERGLLLPEIRAAVRTGDTSSSERQKMAKKPPHILITTPESLYILLTSDSGRRGLKSAHTLILDEIHAVADDKRGSHLALSVERLCALTDAPVTRVGLSATQRPIEEMARFLVGNAHIDGDGAPDCLIVDTGHARTIDLKIRLPQRELGPIASHEQWGETLDDVAELVMAHGTTLMFVNTRRLVERLSHQLSERLGEEAVVAHHGSLSRATRLAAEDKLKRGEVKVCVATASLELGIDIGDVDLVCQMGSPRSIGLLLQRIGRSGHSLGAVPKGRLFPMTRDELVECVALLKAVRRGELDTLRIPPWPLDVMAQQMVAACAVEEWSEDDLFDLCRRAYPYRELDREKFDQITQVLSEGFTSRRGRGGAFLHRDGVHGRLTGRRGARIAAMTGGGAIPDNADYDVIAEPEDVFVGSVNEDFAIESMAGDVFLLGNNPWKIRRVESGRVRVEDAHGLPPSIPFWLGEAPGRTWELSQEVTELREAVSQRLERPHTAEQWVMDEAGVDREIAEQLVAYHAEGVRVLGMVPTGRRVVAERFFDESGGMQLVIHAPFGSRINRAWGMALRKKICRTFDFELQAAATDDGLNFSLGPSQSFPLEDVFRYIRAATAEEVLLQAVLQAPLFGTRWRWDATRALAVMRFAGGRKVPAPLQRMRSDDLLAAVFPEQVACQDNAMPGDIEVPDHPLVFETVRDCLTEAMDVEGLKSVLAAIESGEIEVYARDTVQPSVFAHQLLNTMPYAFLDEAPLEERRARAVPLRRALPDARDLTALDADAIRQEAEFAWPLVRDPAELHDALLVLGVLPLSAAWPSWSAPAEARESWFRALVEDDLAYVLHRNGVPLAWVAAERVTLVQAVYPNATLEPVFTGPAAAEIEREDAVVEVLRGWTECGGPFTVIEMADRLGLSRSDVAIAVARLEAQGQLLRGRFSPGAVEEELCDRRVLARIHHATIGRLRREVEPVSHAVFMRFLLRWQHILPSHRLSGEDGVLEAIEQLQGFEAAASAWESEILPARVADYSGALLDRLCWEGEVTWGRFSRANGNGSSAHGRGALTRATPITLALRESLDWLLEPSPADDSHLPGGCTEILELLSRRGASFTADIIAATRRLPSDVEDILWQLAAAGRVTCDGLEPLRRRLRGGGLASPSRRGSRARRGTPRRSGGYSRWSALEPLRPFDDPTEERARQLLARYGVLFPELLARESSAPPWRELVRLLRRLEARGEIRGGRFVAGFVGEQFALPEAVELLRSLRDVESTGETVTLSAMDPLNLAGILSPGERVPAQPGNRVTYRDGVPVGEGNAAASTHASPDGADAPVEVRVVRPV
ncbi:MAG: DEAD/DEAH box helicase [Chloroflexota bacterium]|nr:DEAD/DEAH box helicase [Chloroflexota bacterium]MDE2941206.1 DEAD/DEAH box helicase [Chloroflexota bacterium]MDE3268185.1 DEAD/DEAH box helicase [Chloroflexota bacterium]